ncbi:MAG: nucleoid-associated protein [Bacteroidetes bacterium]|jgi:hypothetical protein|nr:nucleoid-associated protein [Bacteroidota bacterium]
MSWYQLARLRALSIHRIPQGDVQAPTVSAPALTYPPQGAESPEFLKYLLGDLPQATWYRPDESEASASLHDILQAILEEPDALHDYGKKLAQRLADTAPGYTTRKGVFILAFFDNVTEGQPGIGLFKAETEESILALNDQAESWELTWMKGLSGKRPDKGALFIPDEERGFKAIVADKNAEIKYWLQGFLSLNPHSNAQQATRQVMDLIKGFSEDVLSTENKVERTEQMAFLDQTSRYLSSNPVFDVEEFGREVIHNSQLQEAFMDYKVAFEEERETELPNRVNIEQDTVVKQHGKFMRSVIKLDKNFHVYVHGNKDFIERGFDEEKGKYYYKLYFSEES